MTWTRRLHAGAIALVLAGGCGALGLRTLDAAEPVTVDDALQRFRAADAAPGGTPAPTAAAGRGAAGSATARPGAKPAAAPGPGSAPATTAPGATPAARPSGATAGPVMPPEGVYVFTTTGFETGDAGPAHARHDYPAETTSTIRHDGCGYGMRWEPNEDRWDDVRTCVSGNTVVIKVYDTMHSFFGVKERHTYQCAGTAWFRPPSTNAGYRWSFDCDSGRARTHTEARIVGIEDGALHIRFDTTMSGATEGTNPSDYWLALDGPYLLRKTGRVDATVHSDFGSIDYHEEYDVRLTSRRPRT